MKHTVSGRRNSSASATSTEARRRAKAPTKQRFLVCVNNAGYEVSLERNKIYVALPDAAAEESGDVRVIDESGEDYLFAAERFIAIELPDALRASLLRAS
jgi:hypothetical protein